MTDQDRNDKKKRRGKSACFLLFYVLCLSRSNLQVF